ncbi:GNS1/SUR4 family protein [Hirsutella rhossiliensis]|uniref:Elongation of fatty acids protein n=1 Tax=Hirsutella rhossiliensis TaxID=111463 RepID=A0A9P8MXP6_9HYPO|nr:GNS1/SUR4 family domain-containing protein [Hirsutella rhossiliensis]KAH0963099.1 GNS1/SUR4 family domain-containing protein [Hirsutella rhossiliensis]
MAASSGAHIVAAWPEAGLFTFPPPSQPLPLAPAPAPASIMRPFNIPDDVFTAALDPKVPLTIAALYAVTVKALNVYNRSRAKRPWAVSKTRPFFVFVVLHNLFLALYSAWTFWGMLGGMRRSIVHPMAHGGLAATADSFCRLHGPAGLGASVYYNETSGLWNSADPAAVASAMDAGRPSSAQPGRIWNEGLAYYGWIFYLSKFYEVLDTFIILAKGKYSSTLQTYHHAGAMMCMWAGMRYMSAPIWMFVLVNSFIHSLMYAYYTLTAFSIKVPMAAKRTLTTLQITQFLVGASYAIVHSFVTYVAPVTVTRPAVDQLDVVAAPENPVAPVPSGALDALKRLFLGSTIEMPAVAVASVQEPTMITETVHVTQPCIVTAGETFAIWLNVLYLAPLTYLFVSFFIASYVKRSNAVHKMKGKTHAGESNVMLAEKAGWDAARGVEREVYGGENMVNGKPRRRV